MFFGGGNVERRAEMCAALVSAASQPLPSKYAIAAAEEQTTLLKNSGKTAQAFLLEVQYLRLST
jgi:hypothetical protein